MGEQLDGDDADARRTAEHLRRLLQERFSYANRWRAHARQATRLNQSAVARVLAGHLWETGQADERDLAVPRRLKDVVSRALSGRHLSARTLTWFIEAFEMTPSDAGALWAMRVGGTPEGTLPIVRGHAGTPARRPASGPPATAPCHCTRCTCSARTGCRRSTGRSR